MNTDADSNRHAMGEEIPVQLNLHVVHVRDVILAVRCLQHLYDSGKI